MEIDIKRLKEKRACAEGIEWLESLGTIDGEKVIDAGIKAGRWSDLRWGISRLVTKKQCVEWAIYCAEQVIDIFEAKCPEDDRPRKAINAAKAYLESQIDANKRTAYAAAAYAYTAYAAVAAYADDAAYADAAAVAADAFREKCIRKGYEILSR